MIRQLTGMLLYIRGGLVQRLTISTIQNLLDMSTNFPSSLDNLDTTRGANGQPLDTPNHVTHHTNEDDAIEAIQTKIGVDGSAVTTSLDYKVANKQPLDSDLTAIAGLSASNDDVIQRKSGSWTNRTIAQVTADIPAVVGDSGSGGTKGLVPAPAAGDATKYLKGDGTWAAVSGGGTGDVIGPATNTDLKIPQWNGANSKTLKDGLTLVTTLGNPGADTSIPSEKAVRAAISSAGGGDVTGPASSTDNAIARFDSTTGKAIQDSLVTVDDTGSVNVPTGQAYKINGSALTAANVGAIATTAKGAASGIASLDGSTKVVENPANATATATASKIPIADGSGKLDTWITDAVADGSTKGKAAFATNDFNTSSGVVSIDFANGQKASDAQPGFVSELATAAETTTGSDTARVVTPGGFAGSDFGKRIMQVKIFDDATAVTTGDGKIIIAISEELNTYNLVKAHAYCTTVSSSGNPTVQIRNVTDSVDILSTAITIDATEYTSYTAATAPVIDTTKDDVATGDRIAIDVDGAGTGTKGLGVILTFQKT